jgi:hypothetical protein
MFERREQQWVSLNAFLEIGNKIPGLCNSWGRCVHGHFFCFPCHKVIQREPHVEGFIVQVLAIILLVL